MASKRLRKKKQGTVVLRKHQGVQKSAAEPAKEAEQPVKEIEEPVKKIEEPAEESGKSVKEKKEAEKPADKEKVPEESGSPDQSKEPKPCAAAAENDQPEQEEVPAGETGASEESGAETGGQDVCFQIDVDLQQEEKEDMKTMNFYVQWNGREFCQADIVEQIRKQWEGMGRTPESLEKLNIYLKPEESKAYYVANDSVQGCVEL